jgi:hypothetical protein
MTTEDIDTTNDQGVALKNDHVIVLMPKVQMTKAEALRHAAWLVAIADDSAGCSDFGRVLQAVQHT